MAGRSGSSSTRAAVARVAAVAGLVLAAVSPAPALPALVAQATGPPPEAPAPPEVSPVVSPEVSVVVQNGRMSVESRGAALADVLRLIGERAGITMHLDGDLSDPINGVFPDIPLEAGIRRLARDRSLSFAYGDAPGGGSRLTEVWVIGTGDARRSGVGAAPRAPGAATAATPAKVERSPRSSRITDMAALAERGDDAAISELVTIATQDADPATRSRAVTALTRVKSEAAVTAVTSALGDPEPSIRMQAAWSLRRIAPDQAGDAVGQVLLGDSDPKVRRAAARALGALQGEAAGAALRSAASSDTNPQVRSTAATELLRWERRQR